MLFFGDPFYSLSILVHSHPVARLMNGKPLVAPSSLLPPLTKRPRSSSLVSLLGDRSGLPTITSCSFFLVPSSSFLFFSFRCLKDIIARWITMNWISIERFEEVYTFLEIGLGKKKRKKNVSINSN